jgi:hypothetical protein
MAPNLGQGALGDGRRAAALMHLLASGAGGRAIASARAMQLRRSFVTLIAGTSLGQTVPSGNRRPCLYAVGTMLRVRIVCRGSKRRGNQVGWGITPGSWYQARALSNGSGARPRASGPPRAAANQMSHPP